jgi:hypothetical protein
VSVWSKEDPSGFLRLKERFLAESLRTLRVTWALSSVRVSSPNRIISLIVTSDSSSLNSTLFNISPPLPPSKNKLYEERPS